MFDQLFDGIRKASESSLQMQQDMFRYMTQQWTAAPPASGAGAATEWGRPFQKRFLELAVEVLNRHREQLDATYKTGIQMIEQAFHLSEAKSSEDYRRMVEDLWRKLYDVLREQSEGQFRDFHRWSEKSATLAQNGKA